MIAVFDRKNKLRLSKNNLVPLIFSVIYWHINSFYRWRQRKLLKDLNDQFKIALVGRILLVQAALLCSCTGMESKDGQGSQILGLADLALEWREYCSQWRCKNRCKIHQVAQHAKFLLFHQGEFSSFQYSKMIRITKYKL